MTPGVLLVLASSGAVLAAGVTTAGRLPPRRRPTEGVAVRSRRRLRRRLRALFDPILTRRPTDDDLAVAAWCSQLAREVRGGAALATALRSVPAPQFAAGSIEPALLAVERGAPIAVALRVAPSGSTALDLAASVIVATATFGGATAEPLDHVASVLRRRSADRAEAFVHAAQTRLSATVMSALPPAFLALLLATTPDTRASVRTPVGATVIAVGALLNVAGWRWMRRVVRSCR